MKMAQAFWQFTSLLKEGYTIQQAANKLSIPRRTAYRWAKLAVEEKHIEPITAWPITYRKKTKNGTYLKPVGKLPNQPLGIPHRFGGLFMQLGRPAVQFDARGKWSKNEGSHSIQFGRSKAQIWIKQFRGLVAKEILDNAYEDMMSAAAYYSEKFGIQLTLIKYYNGIEWVLIDHETSGKLADLVGLEKGEKRELGDAQVVYSDSSHPDQIEFNRLKGHPEYMPTVYWRSLEYLVRQAPLDIERASRLITKIAEANAGMEDRIKRLEAKEEQK